MFRQIPSRPLLLRCFLAGLSLLATAGCASSGASSTSLPEWSEYVGRYSFDAISEGQQVEGYLVLHSLDEYSVRFMFSPGSGNRCTRVYEGRELKGGARARLRGNRLTLTCRGLNLVVRRDVSGLEGYASWQITDTRIVPGECIRYATNPSTGARMCVKRSSEEQTFDRNLRGTLKLTKLEDEDGVQTP
jgi:hypothetical protein